MYLTVSVFNVWIKIRGKKQNHDQIIFVHLNLSENRAFIYNRLSYKNLKKLRKINQRNDFEGTFTVGYYVTEDN